MNYIGALPSTTDDSLLDNLSPADFLRYGRTCTTAHYTVKAYIQRRFQVHRLLAPYFTESEIIQFRALQYTTGMFISGSAALQFFARTYYPGSDLDLYLEHRYRREVAEWLTEIGYKYRPKGKVVSLEHALMLNEIDETTEMHMDAMEGAVQETRAYIGAKMVLDFEKQEPYRKIQLITSHRSAFERLLNFHSTCVMNLITYDRAYCLYPLGTLEERRSLTYLREFKPLERRIRDKYTTKGFQLQHVVTRDEFDDPHAAFARGERHVGDDRCWTLDILPPFDYTELDNDELDLNIHRPMEVNSWELQYNPDLCPVMRYDILGFPRLRFQYTLVLGENMDRDLASLIRGALPRLGDSDGDSTIFDLELESVLRTWRKIQERRLIPDDSDDSEDSEMENSGLSLVLSTTLSWAPRPRFKCTLVFDEGIAPDLPSLILNGDDGDDRIFDLELANSLCDVAKTSRRTTSPKFLHDLIQDSERNTYPSIYFHHKYDNLSIPYIIRHISSSLALDLSVLISSHYLHQREVWTSTFSAHLKLEP